MTQSSEYEYDDSPPYLESATTPSNDDDDDDDDDQQSDSAPSKVTHKDAREVYSKVISTNFSILCAGFNGMKNLSRRIPCIIPAFPTSD